MDPRQDILRFPGPPKKKNEVSCVGPTPPQYHVSPQEIAGLIRGLLKDNDGLHNSIFRIEVKRQFYMNPSSENGSLETRPKNIPKRRGSFAPKYFFILDLRKLGAWKKFQKIFSQKWGFHGDKSHGDPIRKKSPTKTNHQTHVVTKPLMGLRNTEMTHTEGAIFNKPVGALLRDSHFSPATFLKNTRTKVRVLITTVVLFLLFKWFLLGFKLCQFCPKKTPSPSKVGPVTIYKLA